MSDIEIPARIDGTGAIRFGESFVVTRQDFRVEYDPILSRYGILTIIERREYCGGGVEFVEVGKFKLEPLTP